MRHSPPLFRFVVSRRTRWLFSWLIQDVDRGALPTLRAATDPGVRGGEYYGPDGWKEFTGRYPVRVTSTAASHDVALQDRLWAESQRLTGVTSWAGPCGAGSQDAVGLSGAGSQDAEVRSLRRDLSNATRSRSDSAPNSSS